MSCADGRLLIATSTLKGGQMDFWSTILVLFKRWYVAIPAFALSLGIAGLVYASVPVQYVSTSVLVLTAPTTGPTQQVDASTSAGLTNPLLNFSQGLSLSASILIQSLQAPETASSIGIQPNGDTSYEVSNGSTNPELLTTGPFVFITGHSDTAQGAQSTVRKVVDAANQQLAARQSALDAPPSTYISIQEVVPPTTSQNPKGSRLRAAGVAGLLSLIFGLTSVYACESVADRRRGRRTRAVPTRRGRSRRSSNGAALVASPGRSQ